MACEDAQVRVADAADRFRDFAVAEGVDFESALAPQLVGLMIEWYATERVDEANMQADGDMLLFQWGTYDWGDGPSFQYDITRQLIDENDPDDDGAIWQLSVTAHYPENLGRKGGSGSRWCHSPHELGDFWAFIQDCDATQLVRERPPSYVEINYEQAG